MRKLIDNIHYLHATNNTDNTLINETVEKYINKIRTEILELSDSNDTFEITLSGRIIIENDIIFIKNFSRISQKYINESIQMYFLKSPLIVMILKGFTIETLSKKAIAPTSLNIKYKNFPVLNIANYKLEEIPILFGEKEAMQWSIDVPEFFDMISYIIANKSPSTYNPILNLYLSKETINKIDEDTKFREKYLKEFIKHIPKRILGCILFDKNKSFLYITLSKQDTKAYLGKDGNYVACGFFIKELFMGFESGIISNNKLEIIESFYYDGYTEGFIESCLVALAYSENNKTILKTPKVKETIYKV